MSTERKAIQFEKKLPHNNLGYRFGDNKVRCIQLFKNKSITVEHGTLTFGPANGAPQTGGPHCTTLELPCESDLNHIHVSDSSTTLESNLSNPYTMPRAASFF